MRLKSIAVLVVAILLVAGSASAMAIAGAEDRDSDYWWEDPCCLCSLTPYERQQMMEIMILVFDRYFGIDVSAMSPQEYLEVGLGLGSEGEEKLFRLVRQYAEKRGLDAIRGIISDPLLLRAEEEYKHPVHLTPADVTYWWELVSPRCREATIAVIREEWPEIDVRDIMNMAPGEVTYLLNPPPPPLRLLSIAERKEKPAVVAIYGRARLYDSQDEIQEWLDKLSGVVEEFAPLAFETCLAGKPVLLINRFGVCPTGYISVGLDGDRLKEIDEALAFAAEIYSVIAEKAEAVGIEQVPAVFSLGVIRLLGEPPVPCAPLELGITGEVALLNLRHEKHRPIIGGIQKYRRRMTNEPRDIASTIGLPLQHPTTHEEAYTIAAHLGRFLAVPIPANTQIYQPTVAPVWWPWLNRAGRVAEIPSHVAPRPWADVARVPYDVSPKVVTADRTVHSVWYVEDPRVGQTVFMSGRTSGRTSGMVLAIGWVQNPVWGWLPNQGVSNLLSAPGDSGAPIFWYRNGRLVVCGSQWGIETCAQTGRHIHTFFSRITEILQELAPFRIYTIHCP